MVIELLTKYRCIMLHCIMYSYKCWSTCKGETSGGNKTRQKQYSHAFLPFKSKETHFLVEHKMPSWLWTISVLRRCCTISGFPKTFFDFSKKIDSKKKNKIFLMWTLVNITLLIYFQSKLLF